MQEAGSIMVEGSFGSMWKEGSVSAVVVVASRVRRHGGSVDRWIGGSVRVGGHTCVRPCAVC